jgi:glucokinase
MKKASGPALVLAGDVGGTKTRLGVFRLSKNGMRLLQEREFPSAAYSGFEKVVETFSVDSGHIQAACFGVAGPVVNGTAIATNLPWKISEPALRRFLSIPNVSVINDLVANARGIGAMEKNDFAVLNRGGKATGNSALLAAGTGLGAAILFWDGKRNVPCPSEGGHAEFGPKDHLELGLLRYLFQRFGHVSYERILSGPGLFNIYQFLKDTGAFGKEPRWLGMQLEQEDPAAVITEAARLGKSRICQAVLELFTSIYGAAAGNLALQVMAVSGVYIGGGIAPKIVWKLKDGTFMKAFRDKGRLSPIVARIPVKVIMNDRAALFGAALHAADLNGESPFSRPLTCPTET